MSNILALAHKEVKSAFSTPIAYVVIGFFALLWGWFFWVSLIYFNQQSLQFAGPEGGGANINQQLIRPLFLNASVILLFVLPLITMRTYSEEKRSGTMELLLTSPVTDLDITLGKFLGAVGVYAAMLAVTLVHIGILFGLGDPEWKPIVAGYLGLLLLGASFISIGLFISSTTKNQVIAGAVTFIVALTFWIINWFDQSVTPQAAAILNYLSVTQHFDDFGKGVIDTKHIVFYLSFIAFGLFLTLKSLDTERWRS